MKLDTIVAQQVIYSDRLVLRPLRRSDVGLIALYADNEDLARMTTSIRSPVFATYQPRKSAGPPLPPLAICFPRMMPSASSP